MLKNNSLFVNIGLLLFHMKFRGKLSELRNLVKDINDLRKRHVWAKDAERPKIEAQIEQLKLRLR